MKTETAMRITYFEKEFVLYRTKSGKLTIRNLYCPHLGADLSQGVVKGEHLLCCFHGYKFGSEGESKTIKEDCSC